MRSIFFIVSHFVLLFPQAIDAMEPKPAENKPKPAKSEPKPKIDLTSLKKSDERSSESSPRPKEELKQLTERDRSRSKFSLRPPLHRSTSSMSPTPSKESSSRQKQTCTDKSTLLIHAVRKRNEQEAKKLICDPECNPNLQDALRKNTAFHLAVLTQNPIFAQLFLENPNANILIKNEDGRAPYQLLSVRDNPSMYNDLYLRAVLDRIVHALMITDEQLTSERCSDELILKKIDIVKQRLSKNTLPTYTTNDFMLAMIKAHLKHNALIIKIMIDAYKKDPNQKDEWGNTFIHHAVYVRDRSLITTLVHNPDLNSLIRNDENQTAHLLIPSTENQSTDLRFMLFTRDSLENWIQREAPIMLIVNPVVGTLTIHDPESPKKINPLLSEAMDNIKKNYDNIESLQGDSDLPEETRFPSYATDEFIGKMLQRYMKKEKPTVEPFFLVENIQEPLLAAPETPISFTECINIDRQNNDPVVRLKRKPTQRASTY